MDCWVLTLVELPLTGSGLTLALRWCLDWIGLDWIALDWVGVALDWNCIGLESHWIGVGVGLGSHCISYLWIHFTIHCWYTLL